jgi:hypothetical protein
MAAGNSECEKCGLTRTSIRKRNGYYIRCGLSYTIGFEHAVANVRSEPFPAFRCRNTIPIRLDHSKRGSIKHPPGTPIPIRYEPANHSRILLASDFMPPRGRPKTPNNLKLLAAGAASFLLVLTIARLTRPPSSWRQQNSSAPPRVAGACSVWCAPYTSNRNKPFTIKSLRGTRLRTT